MSAATMSGSDAVKTSSPGAVGGSKQQLKSSTGGKALDGARKQAASPVDGQKGKPQQPPQPKAWQGPNPITQRASTHTPNGTEKSLPKLPPQPQTKSTMESNGDKHAHDRALFILANFIGCDATLTLKNGEQYTGVFSGGSFESSSKHQYILKMVRRTALATHQQVNGNSELSEEYVGEGDDHIMVFDKEDTVDLAVNDVLPTNAMPLQNGSITSSFRTDTEISGRDPSMPRERELQRWEPGADSSIDMSLESSGDTSWDQFATNERMYGVQSTYDEEIYTTSIDRADPAYRQREAEAARIAREIEGSAPATAHVAEERRRDADPADGLDEEQKYSGVQREAVILPKRGAGAYVPPSQRPITNLPTVSGAPFDPAIISSQLAKPTPIPNPDTTVEPVSVVEPRAATSEEEIATGTASATKAVSPPEETAKRPMVEDHVRNVTEAFKQFANDQKLRSRQAAEAKRTSARAEKNVKLNDLKKFAENFKLKSRVPDDLVPILAKDPHKQHEIQHKAEEAAKSEEVRVKEMEKEKSVTTASPTPSASSQIAPTPPTDQRAAFNQQQASRARVSQNIRALPVQQSPSKNLPQGVMTGNRGYPRQVQPLPPGMQIPTGPAIPDATPLSPSSRLNAGAKTFEFRPVASSFTPVGTSPSPQRTTGSSMDRSNVSETANFFDKDKKPVDNKERKDADLCFHPIKHLHEAEHTEDQKKAYTANGGVPQPYRTPPTWPYSEANVNVYYKDSFVKSRAASTGPSPMQTPNPHVQMPHAHQLPTHLQGTPQMSTPSQRPPYMAPPQQPGVPPQGFDPRMQQFGPNGSVQSSPRFPQAQMAFNGQMQGMPMPQYGGQQMQGYGMSPSMQYRSLQMPPNGPMMMPNQQHGQMASMPQGYPRGPVPHGYPPPMMGGVPMANQQSGGFMNGPMPQQQSYSPMPPPSQPHMPHMQNQGYAGSPRPHMMQHSGSHQGFQPNMMQPQFAPSPGQPHPYHMQQRQMSAGGYPHMTPRQHHSMPHHPSPGMGVPSQGDEGK